MKALKRFATTMKWPNLNDTLDNLDDKDEQFALDTISSDALAYFSGLILPGVSLVTKMQHFHADFQCSQRFPS